MLSPRSCAREPGSQTESMIRAAKGGKQVFRAELKCQGCTESRLGWKRSRSRIFGGNKVAVEDGKQVAFTLKAERRKSLSLTLSLSLPLSLSHSLSLLSLRPVSPTPLPVSPTPHPVSPNPFPCLSLPFPCLSLPPLSLSFFRTRNERAPSGVTSEATQHCCENNCHNVHYHDQAEQTVTKDIW